jgi:hypothetical protein
VNLVTEVGHTQDPQADLTMKEEDIITNVKKSTEKDTTDLVTSMRDQDQKTEVVNIGTENVVIQTNVNEEENEIEIDSDTKSLIQPFIKQPIQITNLNFKLQISKLQKHIYKLLLRVQTSKLFSNLYKFSNFSQTKE